MKAISAWLPAYLQSILRIIGMEKLVPTLHDAYKVAEVTWRYANYTVPGYVSLISSPSKTGDIEKVTTYGAHGPKELHVIFLDGGTDGTGQRSDTQPGHVLPEMRRLPL